VSINRAILLGNVGRDCETRRVGNSDDIVATFSLATSETWRDKASGERKESTEWHNIVIFNQMIAKVAEQYVKKGSKVSIEGAIKTREYTDKDGNKRKATDIVINRFDGKMTLEGTPGGGGGTRDSADYGNTQTKDPAGRSGGAAGGGRSSAPPDDDIPF
jgi:single-strand DNA-binding protein